MKRFVAYGGVLSALLGVPGASAAPILNQVDTFEDGTTQSWSVGGTNPNPPVNIGGGGPGGASDRYLQFVGLGGSGPGSRLSIFNSGQWSGNYTAAGVTALSFDIANFGATDLEIGLRIEGAGGALSSISPTFLPADGQWYNVVVGLDDSSLAGGGEFDLPATLAAVSRLRIEDVRGSVVGIAGVDNIRAIPEPGSLALLALAALGLRRR